MLDYKYTILQSGEGARGSFAALHSRECLLTPLISHIWLRGHGVKGARLAARQIVGGGFCCAQSMWWEMVRYMLDCRLVMNLSMMR